MVRWYVEREELRYTLRELGCPPSLSEFLTRIEQEVLRFQRLDRLTVLLSENPELKTLNNCEVISSKKVMHIYFINWLKCCVYSFPVSPSEHSQPVWPAHDLPDVPLHLPVTIQDNAPHKGNLFTHFLHAPLQAFCYSCDITDVPCLLWQNCQAMVQKIIEEGHIQIVKSKTIGEEKLMIILISVSVLEM